MVSFLVFTSCGRRQQETSTKQNSTSIVTELSPRDINNAEKGDWIIKQELADAEKLNPIVTNDASADDIDLLMYETLLRVNRETYELEPVIAKSLPVISDDHLSYTFELKENAKFSDGHPLTGEDIIFTIKCIKNPFTDAQALRNYFADLKNAELVDGNKYKVRFNMTKPYFRAIYTLGTNYIVPKHILDKDNINDKISWEDLDAAQKTFDPKKYSDMQKYANFLNSQEVSRDAKYLIGSGPYKFDKWQTGQAIYLSRNDNYWNNSDMIPNFASKIVFKIIQDQNAAVVAAKNKEIDYMFVIRPIDFVDAFKTPEQFNLKKALVLEPTYSYIGWNNLSPIFSDKKVRWAMSYAIDRKTMIDKILYGMAVPIQSHIFYKNKLVNNDLPEIKFDLEKARSLLTEAGWKDTDGDGIIDKVINGKKTDFKFTFINNANPTRKQIMLIIIESLKQLGIQADLQDFEWSVFLDKQKKHQFDAGYGAWQLSVTPEDPFQIWHSTQSQNEGSNSISYNNPESDKLLEENRVTFDENKRVELMKKWQQLIYDDQPYTFLWTQTSRYIYSDRFKNTRWYAYPSSAALNEWWAPKNMQRYQ
jgi:peptide/nickel transport system substrate-binding protein